MLIEFPIESREGPKGPIKENMLININEIVAVYPETGESTKIDAGTEYYVVASPYKEVKEKLRRNGV